VVAQGTGGGVQNVFPARLHGLAEGVGQGARLARSGLQQNQFGIAVGRRGAQLGAWGNGGDQVRQMLHHLGGGGTVGGQPIARVAALDVGDQGRHVHHHIAIVQAAGQFGLAQVAAAGFLLAGQQVVDGGEVVGLRFLAVDGEGMGDMHGGILAGQDVGRNHAPEHGGIQPGPDAQGGDVVLQALQRVFSRLGRTLG